MKALKCKGRAGITSRLRIDVSCKLRPISRIRGRACALAIARRFLCGGSARPEAQGRAPNIVDKYYQINRHLPAASQAISASDALRISAPVRLHLHEANR